MNSNIAFGYDQYPNFKATSNSAIQSYQNTPDQNINQFNQQNINNSGTQAMSFNGSSNFNNLPYNPSEFDQNNSNLLGYAQSQNFFHTSQNQDSISNINSANQLPQSTSNTPNVVPPTSIPQRRNQGAFNPPPTNSINKNDSDTDSHKQNFKNKKIPMDKSPNYADTENNFFESLGEIDENYSNIHISGNFK